MDRLESDDGVVDQVAIMAAVDQYAAAVRRHRDAAYERLGEEPWSFTSARLGFADEVAKRGAEEMVE